jgi:hypothetical protein
LRRKKLPERAEKGEYAQLLKAIREKYPNHLAELTFALDAGVPPR